MTKKEKKDFMERYLAEVAAIQAEAKTAQQDNYATYQAPTRKIFTEGLTKVANICAALVDEHGFRINTGAILNANPKGNVPHAVVGKVGKDEDKTSCSLTVFASSRKIVLQNPDRLPIQIDLTDWQRIK